MPWTTPQNWVTNDEPDLSRLNRPEIDAKKIADKMREKLTSCGMEVVVDDKLLPPGMVAMIAPGFGRISIDANGNTAFQWLKYPQIVAVIHVAGRNG